MPKVILDSKDDFLGAHKRGGGGKERVYPIDFEPLRQVIGVTLKDGKPASVVYEPTDVLSDGGTLPAKLTTIINQGKNWVAHYNETEAGDTKYRFASEAHKIRDKDGDHLIGRVEDGKIVEDRKNGVALYNVRAMVVPLTREDVVRMEAANKRRAATIAKRQAAESENQPVSESQGEDKAEGNGKATNKPQPASRRGSPS